MEIVKLEGKELRQHIERAWEFYRKMGSPKYVCAPMVDQSELPFRMLTRKYNTDLCYTPMLHSRMMVDDQKYKKNMFSTAPEDRPLITQFCGNDPEIVLKAAKLVEDECDAVDLNLGCPQGIARKGHYGSFLLDEPDLICRIVSNLYKNLKIPVTCKIRIQPDHEKTFDLCRRLQSAGCHILTVHGRTKEQNKHLVGDCDWGIIKQIKQMLEIPVFLNGGVFSHEDVQRAIKETGVDGVMSAEALLENPALFTEEVQDLDQLAYELIELCEKYNETKYIKPHLFKILYQGLKENTDLREQLASNKFKTIEEYKSLITQLKERRADKKLDEKFGWYFRYNTYNIPKANGKLGKAPEEEESKVSEDTSKKVKI